MDPLAPPVVLVGSNLLGLYLRRFLVLRGLNHINIRFLTLIDFAKALASEPLNRDGLRPLWRSVLCSAQGRIDSHIIAPPLQYQFEH